MVDVFQVILVMVVTTITVLLVIMGVQVYNILKEFRETIKKVNKMLDDFGMVSESISRPIASLSDVLTGASGVTGILSWLTNRKKKKGEDGD